VGAYWDAGEEQPGRPAVLSVLAGADLSARYARTPADRRPARVAGDLPDASAAVLRGGASVSWEREPFAGGGYARFDVGFDPALRAELSRPVGRLAFAGEHTSLALQGYVAGAVESGRRAADDVRRALGQPLRRRRP
jgi:monoamine oxidase